MVVDCWQVDFWVINWSLIVGRLMVVDCGEIFGRLIYG